MKGFVLVAVVIVAVAMIVTNPDQNTHYEAIGDWAVVHARRKLQEDSPVINLVVTDARIRSVFLEDRQYNDYLLFSTVVNPRTNVTWSFGIFGRVRMLVTLD